MPNASSKALHASIGSHRWGIVESMKIKMPPDGRSSLFAVLESVYWIDCRPTTRSRDISSAKSKVTLLGVNLDESYPPSVRLPNAFFKPIKRQCPSFMHPFE